ncbi:MAG TPA: F0F1 ATP synthase subunit epsilon [Tenuifilaceae bacterium]|nr:F0F1 ATP synthase subunit epsilon [Tenuifilaceae bacterium]
MLLEIVTPERVFFRGNVEMVRVPGTMGSFAMKHNHAPIISTLEPGLIQIKHEMNDRYFELLEPAIVEHHENRVIILAEKIKETIPLFVR